MRRSVPDLVGPKFLIEIGDLFNPPGMPPTIKFSIQPNLDHAIDQFDPQKIRREAKYIQVIVSSTHFGSQVVMAGRCANTGELISSDGHPDTCATNQNSPLRFSVADTAGDFGSDVRVIDAFFALCANIVCFMAKLTKQRDNLFFHMNATMVTPYRDSHGYYFPIGVLQFRMV